MPIIGKFQRKQKKDVPAWIGFQATAGDNTLHLRSQKGGYDCVIDWGDGTKTTAPVDGGNVVHNYAKAGLYYIKISGKSFAGFFVYNQTGKEKYVAVYSLGRWKVNTLISCYGSFKDCANLRTISADAFRYNIGITTFFYCFGGCNLTTVPEELFRYNVNATDFAGCFSSCTSLVSIPNDLFRYNILATTFDNCFNNCSALSTIPPELFRHNTKVKTFFFCFDGCIKLTLRDDIFGKDYENQFNGKTVDFQSCFKRRSYTGTQGTAPELWKFTGLTATKTGCFAGAGNSTASLSNYSSIPADWK